MMERVYNFSPGPSQLALPVLEKAQKDLLCYGNTLINNEYYASVPLVTDNVLRYHNR